MDPELEKELEFGADDDGLDGRDFSDVQLDG